MNTQAKKVSFKSKDGLLISADYYEVDDPRGYMVLCHRSHYNRGEYSEIAPRLNLLGFSCLAIDQRSGMNVLGYVNETSTRAKDQGKPTGYLDARQDIEAAVDFLYAKSGNKQIILVGSSYSASLALLIAMDTPKVKAVVAFSPGEYLKKTSVTSAITHLSKPVYVTSTKKEASDVSSLTEYIDSTYLTQFYPSVEGMHGARTLNKSTIGNEEYWDSLTGFVDKIHI